MKEKKIKKCENDQILSWPPPLSVKFHTFFFFFRTRPSLNPLSAGIQFCKVLQGGSIRCPPPLKSSKMKLSKHLMGQNRGSCGCPTYLDHFQLAVKCISCVCTCLSVQRVSEPIFEKMWNTCGRHLAIVYMYLASLKSPILTNHMTL